MTRIAFVSRGTATCSDGREFNILHQTMSQSPPQTVAGTVPNSSWVYVDKAGHVHRWFRPANGSRDELPTCRVSYVVLECDGACPEPGGCEGYTKRAYYCVQCGEEINPGYRRDYVRLPAPAPEWTVYLVSDTPHKRLDGEQVELSWQESNGARSTINGKLYDTGSINMTDGTYEWQALFMPDESSST